MHWPNSPMGKRATNQKKKLHMNWLLISYQQKSTVKMLVILFFHFWPQNNMYKQTNSKVVGLPEKLSLC